MSLIYTSKINRPHPKWYVLNLILLLFCLPLIAQNVGIGTNNPDEELTVVGTIKSNHNSNSNSPQLAIHEADNEFGRIKFTNEASLQYFTLAANPQGDSTLSRFHVYNSDFGNVTLVTAHGRFGINASNPAATLHLNAKPTTDLIRLQNNNATKFRIFSNNAIVFGANWTSPIANVIRVETPNMFIGYDGNHVPEDRLEVDGNVRIRGGITADTVQGTPGQMLITGTDGNIAWANPCSYSRFNGYPIPGTVQWTVPDGVTEIMVELWGSGGGGANGGGGGSGGYSKAIFTVSPGQPLTVVTGKGGSGVSNGMVQNAGDGGVSQIVGTNVSAAALGGKGATTMTAGQGGLYSVTQPYLSATAQIGENGYHNLFVPIYSGVTRDDKGNGGQSPFAAKNYGKGDVVIRTGPSASHNQGSSGTAPGGGGGGGDQFNNVGGDGYVIIRWN